MHINKINDKKYIGITKQEVKKRWGSNGRYYISNIGFYNAIKQYGWNNFEHIVIEEGLTKKQAEKLEIELIDEFMTHDRNYGYNISTGGGTFNGCKLTDKHKEAISQAQTGRERTEEQRANVSNFFKEYYKNNPHPQKGRITSKESLEKAKQTRIKNGHCNHIYQFDLDGNLIAEYDSALDMKKITGYDRWAVMKAIKGTGSCKLPYGYIWSMNTDIDLDYYKNIYQDIRKPRPVNQYTLQGELIKTYPSMSNASKTNGYTNSVIERVCKGIYKTAYGYIWKFVEDCIDKEKCS